MRILIIAAASLLVAGYMAKQRVTGGQAQAASPGGGLGDLLGGLMGGRSAGGASAGGGFGSMLDMNKDGNPLDDILRMAGKAFG